MKLYISVIMVLASLYTSGQQNDTTLLQPVEVSAVRATERTPVAKTTLSAKEIANNNLGQDLPFIIQQTPSVVVNSDAGNGIGYTGIRIRGTDATRINVTLNGIPYNDAESQGTFFVDVPDIASSANSIQIQRGIGTSTNGAGSFGGSINISTNEIQKEKNLELNNSVGSYSSIKNTIIYNSGILGNHFTVDTRLSNIRSDGYVERATSRLKSFYGSIAYFNKNNSLRLSLLSGKEKTYQSWNGVDEITLMTNRRYNSAGTEKQGEPYANEIDNYDQNHYQLFYNHKFNTNLKASVAFFLTKGKGYYEQYKADQSLSSYGLPDYNDGTTIVTNTDLVRRLWLDNDFYGSVFSLRHENSKRSIILGGNINQYDGVHFGEITSATIQQAVPLNHKWYNVDAFKKDLSSFVKWSEKISKRLETYVDLQVRSIDYTINGFRDNPSIRQENDYFFFNPKVGITYNYNKLQLYASYSKASKEPNRADFESGITVPQPETLHDFEIGAERRSGSGQIGFNIYHMMYDDQLVLTGQINDVGAYTRTNVKKSYRTGVEMQASRNINSWLMIQGNTTISSNKINKFTEYIDDYDNGGQQTKMYTSTDLPFSPSFISTVILQIIPARNATIKLVGKYVGRQYLDNTSNISRSLQPYYVQDLQLNYALSTKAIKNIKLFAHLNNLFSKRYEPNGYTFSYFYNNKLTTENFYYPMAPLNVMIGINLQL